MGGFIKSLEDAVKGIALAALVGTSMSASETPAFSQQQKQERKLQEAKKDEVPDEATQRFREEQVKRAFSEDYKKKDSASKITLADKLAQSAEDPKNDSALRFVLTVESMRAYAEALELNKAFSLAERLSESYNTGDLRYKCIAFNISKKLVKDADQSLSVAESGYELAGSLYIKGDFVSALDIAADAKKLPKLAKDAAQKLNDMESEIKQVQSAELTLSAMPDDAKANSSMARYTAFRRGKLEEAKAFAKKSKDQVLIDLLESELANPDNAESQYMIANQYFEASKKMKGFEKDQYTMRASFWYNEALPKSNALMKADIDKKLKELESPAASANTSLVDLIKLIDVKRDSAKGTWKYENALVSPSEPYAKIIIPFSPTEEYELKVTVEPRGKIGGFYAGLNFGEKQFGVELDGSGGTRSRLYVIDGKVEGVPGAESKGAVLVSGKPNTIVYTVKKSNVTVTVNGKQVINWKADYSKVTPWADWKVSEPKALSFGAYETNCYIQQASLRILSGTGKKLR